MSGASMVRGVAVLAVTAALAAGITGIIAQHSAGRAAHNRAMATYARLEQQLPYLAGVRWWQNATPQQVAGQGTWLPINHAGIHGVWSPWYAEHGYNGRIALLIALDEMFCIRAIDVLSHRETPGLGDRMERRHSAWLDQFIGRCAPSGQGVPWMTRADGGTVDGLTGATVTSRAVVAAVRAVLNHTHTLGGEQVIP